jgi:hypothetical protein
MFHPSYTLISTLVVTPGGLLSCCQLHKGMRWEGGRNWVQMRYLGGPGGRLAANAQEPPPLTLHCETLCNCVGLHTLHHRGRWC